MPRCAYRLSGTSPCSLSSALTMPRQISEKRRSMSDRTASVTRSSADTSGSVDDTTLTM